MWAWSDACLMSATSASERSWKERLSQGSIEGLSVVVVTSEGKTKSFNGDGRLRDGPFD
jgi:hypothetical protein